MGDFLISSKFTNYQYTIYVHVPDIEQPKEGFSIIYILDGLSYFPLAKQVVKLQSRNTLKTRVEDSIVVGICHQEETMRKRRFYDFTAPSEKYQFPERTKGKLDDLNEFGGAENFSRFLMDELKPLIETKYPVNKNKQTIYGHSLSGYYVLWNFLTKPQSFQTYIAVSPSIWWNNRELFRMLKDASLDELAPLFIIVGEREGFMVEDAKHFYEEIPSMNKRLFVADDENHASVVPTTLSRAFRFCSEVGLNR
ncbi:alpha/beta hydrolase-fold protein [Lysinibacillus telephonicus]|uniref:alpha/beta hydrolase n=1 Tax=Lysinibacillus telephonicus TaxID=1714840 RepID=UPI0031FE1713